MFNSQFILIGLALAMDAAVASFALGLLDHEASRSRPVLRGLGASFTFGFFQFFMLWLGSHGGYLLSFSHFGYLYQGIVAATFVFIGIKFFQESFERKSKTLSWGFMPVMALGVVTSVDALATGMSLGTLPAAHWIALDIGAITFILCGLFFALSQFFKTIPDRWLLRLAGAIFLAMGANTVWVHILKGSL